MRGLFVVLALSAGAVTRGGEDAFPTPVDTEKSTARPMDPLEVCRTARLPAGFRLEVFAAEPAVANPIAIDTDARGHVWVAENYSWSGANAGGWSDEFRDRIVVFADEDGDGRHDRRTVFWDGGRLLTSIAVGLGGVFVLDLPRLLFIPDRDGDLVPDGPPETVLDGFDADAVGHTPANGLKWGPDGWLYGRHGIQATSRIGLPGSGDSQRVAINTGVWRYHPGRKQVEGVLHGMTNSWGFDFDARGELFVINTVIGHLWHVVPGSHVERMYGVDLDPHVHDLIPQVADHVHWDTGEKWSDVRSGISDATDAAGGGHAHIGLLVYQGDDWPAEYRDRVYTLNLHGRRINADLLAPRGAGFTASHGPDLALFADPFFRGMDLVATHDGAVLIADWSDTGECHDHDGVHRSSGRIYRLVHGQPRPRTVDVAALDGAALRAALLATDQWWSRAAVREWQRRALAGVPSTTTQRGSSIRSPRTPIRSTGCAACGRWRYSTGFRRGRWLGRSTTTIPPCARGACGCSPTARRPRARSPTTPRSTCSSGSHGRSATVPCRSTSRACFRVSTPEGGSGSPLPSPATTRSPPIRRCRGWCGTGSPGSCPTTPFGRWRW